MYEKYFLDTVKTLNKHIETKFQGMDRYYVFTWASEHAKELYAQERSLDAEMNTLWNNAPTAPSQEGNNNFEQFKTKVLAWGRVVLQIYKKFGEEKKNLQ